MGGQIDDMLVSVFDLTYWLTKEGSICTKTARELEGFLDAKDNTKEDILQIRMDVTEQMAMARAYRKVALYINGQTKDKPTYYEGVRK